MFWLILGHWICSWGIGLIVWGIGFVFWGIGIGLSLIVWGIGFVAGALDLELEALDLHFEALDLYFVCYSVYSMLLLSLYCTLAIVWYPTHLRFVRRERSRTPVTERGLARSWVRAHWARAGSRALSHGRRRRRRMNNFWIWQICWILGVFGCFRILHYMAIGRP